MKMRRALIALLTLIFMASIQGVAIAAPIFVGSWQVDEGPSWTVVPPAYSGIEAAAFLFGGNPLDYAISTISNDPLSINNMAWVSTWGGACGGTFPCGTEVAEDFVISSGGLYQTVGDTSAYVTDWAIGAQFTNYAFLLDRAEQVPAPAPLTLIVLGLLGLASVRRLRIARGQQF